MHLRHPMHLLLATAIMWLDPASASAEATGSGSSIGRKDMPGYCRNMAVEMFALKPGKVRVKKLVAGKAGLTVPGTADQGTGGKTSFHCAFDMEGRFVEMVVEASGGE